jgi:hypothetical protein
MLKKARPTAQGQVLHPEVVEQIKALYASGMTKQGIAEQLDPPGLLLTNIVSRKWMHSRNFERKEEGSS